MNRHDSPILLTPRPYPSKLSLVMPMYNEEGIIPLLRPELEAFMRQIRGEVEVVLVNDGSRDNTLRLLVDWAKQDPRIKVLDFARNFGHQLAATAGLDYATGDAVVLIDADLQDPLKVVHEMIESYQEGYDVIYGQRRTRAGESPFKLFSAWAFYRLMRMMVYKNLPVDTGDFRLMSRPCLDGLQQMRETHRFLRGMVAWVGFSQKAVMYDRNARAAGETKYPLRKMLAFAWTAATSFSTLPLKFSLFMGILAGLFAAEETIRALVEHALGHTVNGWTSLMVVESAIGSSLLISIAILGEYLGKTYEQSKNRPLYLVSRTFNVGQEPVIQGSSTARSTARSSTRDIAAGNGN
jgi:dolichol-phosphate mannosyltransferase